RPATLAAVLTTKHPASHTYVNRKVKACREVGINSQVFHLEPSSTLELLHFIDTLNHDPAIDGILVQLPLPSKIKLLEVLERIDPLKDVDGFHPLNAGKVLLQDPTAFYPCTPLGIKELLLAYNIETAGRHVVILGRSNIVGKPLATLMMQDAPGCNATVTVAHSRSRHLRTICQSADILVTAIGHAHRIGPDLIPDGCVVVDVGINKIEDPTTKSGYRIVGDVDFHAVKDKCTAITPVPGGVGPMTIAMLLKNTLKSFLLRAGK
ncbi:MAG TPA: bifunctional 5,10-methylenetetrahydrofolate dehydrogenase/5,10-methenyltetrahydrofolate cyclohydrolase, partial [Chlamydiales bacterium]|nr:bifunctional 5,10-methylenetetrahydrofolate dehydrogenase/5,10-methenyltetrahydrofolate cyclohydrolase [Chlamydiales bacterium]